MLRFTPEYGAILEANGVPMCKKPGVVWMEKVVEPFEVETNNGLMSADAGDFVAFDPISGHVWPVSDEYVAIHYEEMP